MFDWLVDLGQWLFDVIQPLLTFFSSFIHGLQTIFKMFPKVFSIVSNSIVYLPSLFVVFVTLSIVVYIIYMIVGRNAGGTD